MSFDLLQVFVELGNLHGPNTKVKVRLPNGDTDYFVIVVGVMQGQTLASYLFIICLDFVIRTSIYLMKKKTASCRQKNEENDIALQANTLAQAESLLHSLERAAGGIGLHVNADKTEYMCFSRGGDIYTLNSGPLKLVDKFTYLGRSISSSENDINTRLAKAWTAIDRLSVI